MGLLVSGADLCHRAHRERGCALDVHHMDPADLKPAEYNPRQINQTQLEALKNSLSRWGFVEPVILNTKTGHIVGGHQRVTAALELAMPTVPVIKVELTEGQEKALNIALNKISGDWVADKLADLLADLGSDGWDIADLGFTDDEVHEIVQGWDDPADMSEVGDYDPNLDKIIIKLEVAMEHADQVVKVIQGAINEQGWDYKVAAF
jgi:ParB-like chromosome segregation protein Spo0J